MRAKYAVEAKKAGSDLAGVAGPVKGLRPWREIAEPHDDVAQGRFSMAEFAADLRPVRLGAGRRRVRRTGRVLPAHLPHRGPLRSCLVDAAKRVTGGDGAPVVDLQTNFGGGKTHSMIALYHLFSGAPLADMPVELRTRARRCRHRRRAVAAAGPCSSAPP